MRDRSIVKQRSRTLWWGSSVRIAERETLYTRDGVSQHETLYRAEERRLGGWRGIGELCVWLPGAYFAWAQLHSAIRGGHLPGMPARIASEVADRTRAEEWLIFADRLHDDAIHEDKVRTVAAAVGVEGLIEIVRTGQLLDVLLSMQRAA
jgi:hypothetical protein